MAISFKPDLLDAIFGGWKDETRRRNFPHILGVKLLFLGWQARKADWQENRLTPEQLCDANRLLTENKVLVTIKPGRYAKGVGRVRVTEVRRERLQAITEEGAASEGCDGLWNPMRGFFNFRDAPTETMLQKSPVDHFAALWDSINSKKGQRWQDNPLVYVIRFELATNRDNRIILRNMTVVNVTEYLLGAPTGWSEFEIGAPVYADGSNYLLGGCALSLSPYDDQGFVNPLIEWIYEKPRQVVDGISKFGKTKYGAYITILQWQDGDGKEYPYAKK